MKKKFAIVVGLDKNRGIGLNGSLPWCLPSDLKHFKQITMGNTTNTISPDGLAPGQNAVIMGRKTWDSIPDKRRPLPGRLNIILSSNKQINLPAGVLHCLSLNEALDQANKHNCPEIFVIGGAKVYDESMMHPLCDTLYITEIDGDFSCDTCLGQIPEVFNKEDESNPLTESGITYRFSKYKRTKYGVNLAETTNSACQS